MMLQPGPTPYLPLTLSIGENARGVNLERLSSISGISRSSIAAVVAQLHGPWLLHLGARERIAVLEAMSRLYACLGYRRKEAYVLREVLGCILDLIVCGREEDGLSRMSSVPFTAGLGIKGLGSGLAAEWSGVGVRLSEVTDGNESILKVLTYVCKVLGINLDAVRLVEIDEEGLSASSSDESVSADSEDPFEGNPEPYGWPEIQVGVVREAVAVAEALPGPCFLLCDKAGDDLVRGRLPCGRTVCAFGFENSADCIIARGPVSLAFHLGPCTGDSSEERRQ
jgi:hypothetical protein